MDPHAFWQDLLPPATYPTDGPFEHAYPAELDDGRQLLLPIRALGDTGNGLASLIINQASFDVAETLALKLAERLRPAAPEVVIGLPTLGLTLAAGVARALGHRRYVPLGNSRKFWYEDALSVPLSSVTTPGAGKRLFIDPRMLPLIEGRRVALVDDVISSGSSIVSALTLLAAIGVKPVAIGSAMLQTRRYSESLAAIEACPEPVAAFSTPLLSRDRTGRWHR
ncbi:phosphoribosyltransferase [Martelella endophytica]|uniref:Phosphoribosyltransferase n=1 Tax=Martelella endophytica TaxID=1486262 RepID=A0A0D5LNU4_MAREN|nr:phosphoribosyltransferase [Martelella endophytica]AJY45620.1 phosphoribosyltransferase [Martelella endophytica]